MPEGLLLNLAPYNFNNHSHKGRAVLEFRPIYSFERSSLTWPKHRRERRFSFHIARKRPRVMPDGSTIGWWRVLVMRRSRPAPTQFPRGLIFINTLIRRFKGVAP